MDSRIINMAKQSRFDPAALLAFIQVETGGRGFDPRTGKILIQFEPVWFKRLAVDEHKRYNDLAEKRVTEKLSIVESTFVTNWEFVMSNKVSIQSFEWQAFNIAFAINPNAAMESTSIGLGQIMGFHWKRLGYSSVGAMWDDAKQGLDRQFFQLVRFIETDQRLESAIKHSDWDLIASIYNGPGYKKLAEKLGREPYDVSMAKAWENFQNQIKKI